MYWLKDLGPILWDFCQLTMAFVSEGKDVQLPGLHPKEWTVEDAKGFHISSEVEPKGLVVQLLHSTKELETPKEPAPISKLLKEFQAVFGESKGLPPPRSQDHHITLKNGVVPVCARPYHYTYYKK